jgi:hypothetical protein
MNLNTTPTTINQSDISKSLYNLFIAADTCWGNGDLSGIAPENFNVLAKKFPGFKYFLIKYFTKHFIEDEERYNKIMEQFDNLMKDFFHTKYSPDYPESETNSSDVLDLYNSKYTRCTPSHFNIFLKEDVAELLKMSLLSMFYEMHATIPSDRGGSYTEILNSLFLVYFDVLNKVQIILDRPTLPRTT